MNARTKKVTTRINQTSAARKLGVSRGHLNMVLRGRRQSRSLLRRWHALQALQGRAA